ncbi:MAG: Small-conductance mechanosensitive channel MscMJ [Methanonatronarchaeales archaeon]|nr:Small-conductance mechanosensitive channel MscMJ [Methanonatronarchaeales archaeon]
MALGVLGVNASDVLGRTLFSFDGTSITVSGIIAVVVVLVATFAVSRYVRHRLLMSFFERRDIEESLQYLILRVVHYLLILIGIFVALNLLGIQLTALLALAGVAGLALGFGLQTVVSNFVSGIIIMAERNVTVGDIIEVGGKMGEVEEIETRATTIRTFDNVSVVVPNEDFIAKEVINWSHGDPKVRVHVPIGVSYGSEVQSVRDVLLEIAREEENVLDTPEPEVRFESFGDSSLNFVLLAWVPDPTARKMVMSRLNFEIERRFDEENISIPFPQRSVWFRNELESRSPAPGGESTT